MKVPGVLKRGWDRLYHFKLGSETSHRGRAVKEQALLDELGRMPHYAALLDRFESHIRTQFRVFCDTDDWETAKKVWAEARQFQVVIELVEGAVSAQSRGETAEANVERQVELFKADAERSRESVEQAHVGSRTGVYV